MNYMLNCSISNGPSDMIMIVRKKFHTMSNKNVQQSLTNRIVLFKSLEKSSNKFLFREKSKLS